MDAGTPPSAATIIEMALDEDLGRGDVTTRLSVPPDAMGAGSVIARQDLVVSGLDVFTRVMALVDEKISVEALVGDGDTVADGEKLLLAKGPIASLLMGERVALNFLQRLCGTATLTRKYVDRVPDGSGARIVDTRKTTPGLRFFERRAVIHGGGFNHRVDLSGGVLIKENHIVAAGSLAAAVRGCLRNAPHPLKVLVEVRNEEELDEALDAGADGVLLDNMTSGQISACVARVDGAAIVEASGGINLETVGPIAATGVDVISVGALTHSAPSADISFLIEGV